MLKKQAIRVLILVIATAYFSGLFLYAKGESLSNIEKNKEVTLTQTNNTNVPNLEEKTIKNEVNKRNFRWLLIVTTLIFILLLAAFLTLKLLKRNVAQQVGNDFEILEDDEI